MAGNRSTAVMAGRKAGDSFELFPTPPWGTRAPIEQELLPRGWIAPGLSCWDPCCGRGHMTHPLGDYFDRVFGTDIFDWGHGDRRDLDFTFAQADDAPWPIDWVFANPPFTLAEAFVDHALTIARVGVAILVRLQWLEGGERYHSIWSGPMRPHLVCPFADRLPMIEDVWDPEASSATAYMWLVWVPGEPRPDWPIRHIRPGAERRYSRLSDLALATPGEAARRKAAKDGVSVEQAKIAGGRGRGFAEAAPPLVAPTGLLDGDPVVDGEEGDREFRFVGEQVAAETAQGLSVDGKAAELRRDGKRAERFQRRRAVVGECRGGGETGGEGERETHGGDNSGAEA